QRQTATAEVLQVISSSVADAQPVFDAIVRSAARLFGRKTALRTVEPEGLRRRARSYELTAEEFHGPELMPIDRHSLVGRAVLDGRTLQVADNRAPDTDGTFFASQARELSFRSIASAPLMQDGVAIGVISMSSPEPGALTEPQMALLSAFADQAVIAIQNARLFNETQEALAHQTASADILRVISSSPTDVQPVFEAIVGTAVKHLGCDLALVQTVSGDSYSPQAMATPAGLAPVPGAQVMPVDPDANFPSRAIRSKTLLHVSDWSAVELPPHEQVRHQQLGLNSALYLPLVRGDECVGVLVLGSRKANAFNPKAIALAESFRDQALIAIENVRLFNETQQALERQTASAEVLQVVSSSVADTRPVFDKILDSCQRVIACSDLSLLLVDDAGMVHIGAVRGDGGLKTAENYVPQPLQRTIVGEAVQRRRVMHYPDALHGADVPRPVERMAGVIGNYAVVVAPMLVQERAVGAFFIVRTFAQRQWTRFTEREIALVESFAGQAAIAIQNAKMFRETNEALERQTATADILRIISGTPTDVTPVFDAIAERARVLCGGHIGATTRLEGDMLHMVGYHGTSPEAEAVLRQSFPRKLDLSSSSGRCILSKAPVKIADILLDPAYQLNRVQYRSLLAVPMLQGGEAIGAIVVTRLEAGEIPDKWVGLLQAFADQAVIAIQNVRLFNETQEALAHQTVSADILRVISSSPTDVQPVFEAIVEAAVRLLVSDSAYVLRTDGNMVTPVAGANSGGRIAPLVAPSMPVDADHNFPSRAILSKSLLHLPDWSALSLPPLEQDVHDRFGMRSALFLPLMRGDECLGVLVFGRNKPREFSPKDIALAESFRDQAVIAIENTRLFNETQEALERQTATAEILAVISESPTDVQPVFQAIAERARTLCKADVGATTRLDGDIVHLAGVRALSTQAEDAMRGVFPMAVGAAPPNIRRAIVEQQPIQIADVLAEPGYPSAEVAQRSGFRSILSVPLLLQGRSIGTIGVARREPGRFADSAVALLQTFARQAVIAIENVRLFRETQEALEHQTATSEVLNVIAASVDDAQPVFNKIIDSAAQLFPDALALMILQTDAQDMLHVAGIRFVGDASGPFSPEAARQREQAIAQAFPSPLAGTATELAIRTGLADIPDMHNATDVPGLQRFAKIIGFNFAALFAPLMWEGKGIGSIAMLSSRLGPFGERERALIKTFADQAVIAIQNARLFNETKEALERQTASTEVLQVINASPGDISPVFD
ncbi:MAG: hypothetical protein H6R06_4087, partial [Proteobacteria bacterium]|nr:hypothetical protein [Pseudomonadota bacterium]